MAIILTSLVTQDILCKYFCVTGLTAGNKMSPLQIHHHILNTKLPNYL